MLSKRGDLRPGAVDVLPHADAHVEPRVAVDEVVAAAAFDDVAAVAAEDDVAGVERASTVPACRAVPASTKSCRPLDEGDVGEHAALGAGDGEHGRQSTSSPLQDVGVGRARQAFDRGRTGPGSTRWNRAPAADRRSAAGVEVDGHASRIVLEGRPVEAGDADEAVRLAGAADHDVVAAFAVEVVRAAVADEDVVADDRIVAERVEVVAGDAVGGCRSRSSRRLRCRCALVGLAAEDEVVARAAEGFGRVLAGDDEVAAEAAEIRLMPLPPWMTSLPSSPWMLSSPPMSVMMSSPAPPRMMSLP